MGFDWIPAILAGLIVAGIALLVHGLATVVVRFIERERLQTLPYVASIAGAVSLSLQLLPLGGLTGLVGQVTKPTPVYVGFSVVLVSIGVLAVATSGRDGIWKPPLIVALPVVAVLPMYPIALVLAGIRTMPHSVRLQWQALDQVTVTATLLLLVGSFSVAGYYGRGEGRARAVGAALVPPVVAVGTRIATQATLGAGFDGLSVVSYLIFAPVLVVIGLVVYLIGYQTSHA